jgi:glycine cleavage system H protein
MGDWKIPADCKFTKSDEWIKVEGDSATAGITDYAQDQLSDLVFVELPKVGASFKQGEAFGVVESVKAAGDVNLPVGGEVTAVNGDLNDAPETINEDPFGKGWLVKFKIADKSELDSLMDAAAYKAYCDERE